MNEIKEPINHVEEFDDNEIEERRKAREYSLVLRVPTYIHFLAKNDEEAKGLVDEIFNSIPIDDVDISFPYSSKAETLNMDFEGSEYIELLDPDCDAIEEYYL